MERDGQKKRRATETGGRKASGEIQMGREGPEFARFCVYLYKGVCIVNGGRTGSLSANSRPPTTLTFDHLARIARRLERPRHTPELHGARLCCRGQPLRLAHAPLPLRALLA